MNVTDTTDTTVVPCKRSPEPVSCVLQHFYLRTHYFQSLETLPAVKICFVPDTDDHGLQEGYNHLQVQQFKLEKMYYAMEVAISLLYHTKQSHQFAERSAQDANGSRFPHPNQYSCARTCLRARGQ